MASRAFFQISLKNLSECKTTPIPFWIVTCTFSNNLSWNSCKHLLKCLWHSRASGFQFFHVGYLQAYTRYSFVLITVKSLAAALHGTTVKNCGTNSAFCMLFFITCKGRQEDAQEFLSCILNGMHEEMLQLSQLVSVPDKGTICQILLRAYCSLLLLLVVFNTLYPPQLCISYCLQMLLGKFSTPKSIWKQWFMQNLGGKQSVLGDLKIENSYFLNLKSVHFLEWEGMASFDPI